MADHIFDGVLVNPSFLAGRYKVLSAIMGTVLRVQLQLVSNHAKAFLVSLVGHHRGFATSAIRTVEEILAAKCDSCISWYAFGFGLAWFVNGKLTEYRCALGIANLHEKGLMKFCDPATGMEVTIDKAVEISKKMRK